MSFLELRYFSQALQKHTAANVILPEVGEPPYPTLYLLHGLSDDHTAWSRNTSIERYLAKIPLIVVMPDGGRGFYLDAAQGFRFAEAIGTELPDRIERTFPALRAREGRALAGLSMGGYGAAYLALSRPEHFCAAASLSGAVSFGHTLTGRDGKPQSDEFLRILGADYVGGSSDLWHLATAVPPGTLPALYFNCGTEDFLYENNRDFHAHLTAKKVPHEYVEYPGEHNWAYWDEHIPEALRFVLSAMGSGTPPAAPSAAG